MVTRRSLEDIVKAMEEDLKKKKAKLQEETNRHAKYKHQLIGECISAKIKELGDATFPMSEAVLKSMLDKYLTRKSDRKLFGLNTAEKEPQNTDTAG